VSYIWAADNASELSISSLAYYQHGVMLFSQKEYEDAIELADKIDDSGFVGLKNNLLGDSYNSLRQSKEALDHYLLAYDFYKDKNDLAKVIKLKIDAIGQD